MDGDTTWQRIDVGAALWEIDGTETQLKTADEIDMQSKKIINVTDPTADQDAATKKFVDIIRTMAQGGTGANLTNDPGGLLYCAASALAILADGTSGQYLKSGGTSAPSWAYPVRFYTGTYTGDGAASKAITGVGFQAKLLLAWGQGNAAGVRVFAIKNDQDGTSCLVVSHAANTYNANEITTLGADGFTVINTGGYMNVNTEIYTFTAITW